MQSIVYFALAILLSTKTSIGQDDTDGPSFESRDLTESEICELGSYAETLTSLLFANDVNNVELALVPRDELEAFHDELFSYIVLAENGLARGGQLDLHRRTLRMDHFVSSVQVAALEIVRRADSEHSRHGLWYEYDRSRNCILVHENFILNGCLCSGNHEERMVLNRSIVLPRVEPATRVDYQINENGSMIETSLYHVIPLSLISRFFEVWLQPVEEGTPGNQCVQTLVGRLRRSILKIMLVHVEGDAGFVLFNNGTFALEKITRSSWLKGNAFLGPRNRGPSEKSPEELLEAFEYDVGPIIGQERFQRLIILFHNLHVFLRIPQESQLDRLLTGLELFVGMCSTLADYDLTPLNLEQWEELETVGKKQKYWSVKQPSERFRRFVNHPREKTSGRLTWSKFVADSMKTEPGLPWERNLTCLFNQYLLNKRKPGVVCSAGFAEYLYSKISTSSDWQKCISGAPRVREWCTAYRRAVDEKPRSSKDVQTVINWLSSKILTEEHCGEGKKLELPRDPYKPAERSSSVIDWTICQIVMAGTTALTLKNDCQKIFG